ncbi:MAG TPA: dephospho-CoA kinase [Puia sp.]|nr:dephospho-CoA kinase [Puia sp.]
MLKIGLTGGIGSGKSTVAKIFEVLGIPVYYADDAAKRLMNENEGLKQQIIKHFGENAYIDGMLNRDYISSLVFNNKEKLELLNSLTHPAVIDDSEEWLTLQTSSYIIREAALVFESGINKSLDYVIGVSAPEQLRIERVMKRDHVAKEQVLARMKNQLNEDKKIQLCDFVVYNNEQQLIIPQILKLHEQIITLKAKH